VQNEPRAGTKEHGVAGIAVTGTASSSNPKSKPTKPQLTPLQATVELVKRGHRELLPRLRQQLRDEPQVWQYAGDLAAQSRRAWIELVGGRNDLLKESAALYAEERVKQIAGEKPTPLEQLLAERIVAHELRALYLEALDAQNIHAEGTPIAEFRLKKQEIADRQLARAVKLLSDVRAMLSRTIAIEVKVADTTGHRGMNGNGQAKVDEPKERNGRFGVNRINGHRNGHALLDTCLNKG
jgi:hypothetical protein